MRYDMEMKGVLSMVIGLLGLMLPWPHPCVFCVQRWPLSDRCEAKRRRDKAKPQHNWPLGFSAQRLQQTPETRLWR